MKTAADAGMSSLLAELLTRLFNQRAALAFLVLAVAVAFAIARPTTALPPKLAPPQAAAHSEGKPSQRNAPKASSAKLRRRTEASAEAGRVAFEAGSFDDAAVAFREAAAAAEVLRGTAPSEYSRGVDGNPTVADYHIIVLVHYALALVRSVEQKREAVQAELNEARVAAKQLFANAVALAPSETLLRLEEVVLPYSELLHKMRLPSEAEVLFNASRRLHRKEGRAFPWVRASQMPALEINRRLFTKTSQPWLEPQDFGVALFLAAQADAFRSEVASLTSHTSAFVEYEGHGAEPLAAAATRAARWTELLLYDRQRRYHTEGCKLLPSICQAFKKRRFAEIEGVPGAPVESFEFCCRITVLRLLPQSRVVPHCGLTNQRLIAHLGLRVPEPASCGIRVGDQTGNWEQGKAFVFDDSYLHEAWNNGTEERWVLSVSFIHPELGPTLTGA